MADRHRLLPEISEIVHEAAYSAISSGQYEKALEWLEQGRSIIWSQLLQLRTPVDDLRANDPLLANRLELVSRELERTSTREVSSLSREQITRKHHELASEWEDLVTKARGIQGFEGFLRPLKTISELARAASAGPVIVLCAYPVCCAALILTTDRVVIHVPLSNLSYDKIQEMNRSLKKLQSSGFIRSSREAIFDNDPGPHQTNSIEGILSELWTCIVKPILDHLSLTAVPDGEDESSFPHIWWCPTGPFTFLPIHAAGIYSANEPGSKLSEYAISSYTPTLTALLNAQSRIPHLQQPIKILAISQSTTSTYPPLPETKNEISNLETLAKSFLIPFKSLEGSEASVERVVKEMTRTREEEYCYPWIHFACHGIQNLDFPTKSGFVLFDGILDLSTIIQETSPSPHNNNNNNNQAETSPEFAFLSACKTASTSHNLKDEAIHLAAGLLLMGGYRGIIGTMWSIRDVDGPLVSTEVYMHLLKGKGGDGGEGEGKDGDGEEGKRGPDHRRAGYALSRAVEKLRLSGAPFLAWIPFIHMGV